MGIPSEDEMPQLNENWGSSSLLKILTSKILQGAPNDPRPKIKESGIKSTLPMCTVVPQVPNFHPFRYMINHFQDIAHFRIFPIFLPQGAKLSLFSLYGQRFLRYWQIFKIAIFGHETFAAIGQSSRSCAYTVLLPRGGWGGGRN